MERSKVYVENAIRHTTIDGRVLILDLRTEQYTILNQPASEMWSAIQTNGGDLEQAASDLATATHLDLAQTKGKLWNFVDDCVGHDFLSASPQRLEWPDARKRKRQPGERLLTMRAWWNLCYISFGLSRRGFSDTYLRCGSKVSEFGIAPELTSPLRRAQAAFLRAENCFWYKSAPLDCLPRSLALFRFLRSVGVDATHHIGGRFKPFLSMHAWVQVGDSVILDDSRCGREYTSLASLP
jgi:hypothetical protein